MILYKVVPIAIARKRPRDNHKQVTYVLRRDVAKTHASVRKLQDSLGKVEKQLKQ